MDDKKVGKHGPLSPGKKGGAPDVAPWGANIPGYIPDDITSTGREQYDLNNTGALSSHQLIKDAAQNDTARDGQSPNKKGTNASGKK